MSVEATPVDYNPFEGDDGMEKSPNPAFEAVPVEYDPFNAPSMSDSVGRGVDQMQGAWYGAVEAAGELTGVESVEEWGREGRERNRDEATAYGPAQSFTDIDSASDAGQWVKETLGTQLPMMAPTIAGAAIGAAAGSVVPGIGTAIGGLIGAFVPSWAMNTGEIQGEIKERGGSAPGWAYFGGSAIAALDSVLPGKFGSSLVKRFGKDAAEEIAENTLKKEVKDSALKRYTDGTISGIAAEGITEAAQEAVGEYIAAHATDTPVSETLGRDMLEAGAAGALMGGMIGGPTGVMNRPNQASPESQNLEDTPLDIEEEGQPNPDVEEALLIEEQGAQALPEPPIYADYQSSDETIYQSGETIPRLEYVDAEFEALPAGETPAALPPSQAMAGEGFTMGEKRVAPLDDAPTPSSVPLHNEAGEPVGWFDMATGQAIAEAGREAEIGVFEGNVPRKIDAPYPQIEGPVVGDNFLMRDGGDIEIADASSLTSLPIGRPSMTDLESNLKDTRDQQEIDKADTDTLKGLYELAGKTRLAQSQRDHIRRLEGRLPDDVVRTVREKVETDLAKAKPLTPKPTDPASDQFLRNYSSLQAFLTKRRKRGASGKVTPRMLMDQFGIEANDARAIISRAKANGLLTAGGNQPRRVAPRDAFGVIREMGGIKPDGIHDGEIRQYLSGRPGLVSQRGVSPDYVREHFEEIGFLPSGTTAADLFGFIDQQSDSANKLYHPDDTDLDEAVQARQIEEENARVKEEVTDQVKEWASSQGERLNEQELGAIADDVLFNGKDVQEAIVDAVENIAIRAEAFASNQQPEYSVDIPFEEVTNATEATPGTVENKNEQNGEGQAPYQTSPEESRPSSAVAGENGSDARRHVDRQGNEVNNKGDLSVSYNTATVEQRSADQQDEKVTVKLRTSWPKKDMKVVAQADYHTMKAHPSYRAAKDGVSDEDATNLVYDLISPDRIREIKSILPSEVKVVPVHAQESTGRNKIPMGYAKALSSLLDIEIEPRIVQTNRTYHGKALTPYHRMLMEAEFNGPVERGGKYLIVDDTVAIGGTLAAVKGYIESQGGEVVAISTLAKNLKDDYYINPQEGLINQLEYRFPGISDWWRENFGNEISNVTDAEARQLLAAESFVQIRSRFAKARRDYDDDPDGGNRTKVGNSKANTNSQSTDRLNTKASGNGGFTMSEASQGNPVKVESKEQSKFQRGKNGHTNTSELSDAVDDGQTVLKPHDPHVYERIAKKIEEIVAEIAPTAKTVVADRVIDKQGKQDVWGVSYIHKDLGHIISIALNAKGEDNLVHSNKNLLGTVDHEAIHFLKRAGLIKDVEWRKLRKYVQSQVLVDPVEIRERYADQSRSQQDEEIIAEAFTAWRKDRRKIKNLSVAGRVFRKIETFFQRLKSFLAGEGFTRMEDIFENIHTGKVGRRKPNYKTSKPGTAMFQRQAAIHSFAIPDQQVWSHLSDRNKALIDRLRKTATQALEEGRRLFQDKYLPLKRIQETIENARGKALGNGENAYQAEELYHGRTGRKLEEFQEGTVEPLLQEMQEAGFTIEDVENFLYARHAHERNAQIAKINPDMPDSGSGMSNAEASEILRKWKADSRYQALLDISSKVDRIIKDTQKTRLDGGLVDQGTVDAWNGAYKNYIPLKGLAEEDEYHFEGSGSNTGKGFDVRGQESKRATGRGEDNRATDILSNIMTAYEEAVVRSEKNKVGQTFLNLALKNPNKKLWEVDQVEYEPKVSKATGLVYFGPKPGFQLADNVMAVKVDGEIRHITIHHEGLAKAMKNVGADTGNALVRGLQRVNRFLAAINTSYNPEFVVSNFSRDIQTAAINLQGFDQEKLTQKTMKDVWKAAKGMYHMERGNSDGGQWARYAQQFARAGGQTKFFGLEDIDQKRAKLDRLMKDMDPSKPRKMFIALRGAEQWISDVNTAVENGVRLSAFVQLTKAGVSNEKAASIAKNLTVNFNRKGEYSSTLGAAYLFYNASVQGSVRLLQAMRHKRVRKAVYGVVAANIGLELLNGLMSPEDDDGVKVYDKQTQFSKQHNIIFVNPWADPTDDPMSVNAVTIPMPYGYNVFANFGRIVGEGVRYAMGNKADYDPMESASDMIALAFESFNPIGGEADLLKAATPSITKPFMEIATNSNFMDNPIMPEDRFGQETPDSQKAFKSVHPWLKGLAEQVNELTGGNEVRPGAVDVSPETMEHMIEFVTGGTGKTVTRLTKLLHNGVTGEDIRTDDIPLVRKFLEGDSQYYRRYRYYDIRNAIQLLEREVKALREAGRGQEAKEAIDEHRVEWRLRAYIKRSNKILAPLRKKRNALQSNERLSEKVKKTRLRVVEKRMEREYEKVIRRYIQLLEK